MAGKIRHMSHLLDSYRSNALAARLEAERTNLPNVRQRAVDAAEVWERLFERLEWVEAQQRERYALSGHRIALIANP